MLNQTNWWDLFRAIIAKNQCHPRSGMLKPEWLDSMVGCSKGSYEAVLKIMHCLSWCNHLMYGIELLKNFLRPGLCFVYLPMTMWHIKALSEGMMCFWWTLSRTIPLRGKGNRRVMRDRNISFCIMGSLSEVLRFPKIFREPHNLHCLQKSIERPFTFCLTYLVEMPPVFVMKQYRQTDGNS